MIFRDRTRFNYNSRSAEKSRICGRNQNDSARSERIHFQNQPAPFVQFPIEIIATDAPKLAGQLSEVDAPSAGLIPAELHSVSQPPKDRIHGPTAKPFRLPALGCRGASRGYPGKQLHE